MLINVLLIRFEIVLKNLFLNSTLLGSKSSVLDQIAKNLNCLKQEMVRRLSMYSQNEGYVNIELTAARSLLT